MKKILMTFIMIFSVVLLASCSNVTQSYADKINAAAENKEYYAYADVLEDLGDEAIDMTFLKTGIVVAVKGVTSEEELKAKIENGEELNGIIVGFVAGSALKAYYGEVTEETMNNISNIIK